MKKIQKILLASLGAVLIHIGVVFMTQARTGSDPLTLFEESLVINFGMELGTWNTIVGVAFALVAFICDKKKIGYTTIFYIVTSHFVIDSLMTVILPSSNIYVSLLYMFISIFVISFGSALCVSARMGLSFYDAFLYSVTDRFKINYVIFRYSIEAIIVISSILLHHNPSYGTVVYLITMGPCVSAMLKKIKAPIRRYFGMPEDY